MYEGDTPNAERRAAALSLDRDLLRELLGQEELRDLIDPGALDAGRGRPAVPLGADAGHRPRRPARRAAARRRPVARPRSRRGCSTGLDAEAMLAGARRRAARGPGPRRRRGALDRRRRRRPVPRRARRGAARRPARRVPGGRARRAVAAAACATPPRTARSRPPSVRGRYGIDASAALRELERDGELVRGELRPGGSEREWCDPEVLRRLRRASLAVLRKEIEPAEQRELARFLPAWQGVDRHPASRRRDRPAARGARAAAGPGAARRRVGARRAAPPGRRLLAGLDRPAVRRGRAGVDRRRRARAQLGSRGAVLPRGPGAARPAARHRRPERHRPDAHTRRSASGWPPARASSPTCSSTSTLSPEEIQEALWDLAWAGEATNDAFAPLRAPRLTLARAQREQPPRRRRGAPALRRPRAAVTARPPRRSRAAGR